MINEQAEEILERLWIEVNERKNIPDLTLLRDDTAFQELLEQGYLNLKKEVLFTDKGLEAGRLCVRRHRLAERLLADVLKVKPELIHQAGCKFEHGLHKGIEDNICILLGHPKTCPHGRPIPEGKCCREKKRKFESLVMPLSELKKGQKGKIAYLHSTDKTILRKIMAMGALPGLTIILLQNFPSYVFQIGESRFAIDKEIAEQIQVWI